MFHLSFFSMKSNINCQPKKFGVFYFEGTARCFPLKHGEHTPLNEKKRFRYFSYFPPLFFRCFPEYVFLIWEKDLTEI